MLMNIAIFTDCYIPIKNGVVTSIRQLKEGLEERGHNVLIITVDVPNYEEKDKNVYRVPSVRFGAGTEQRIGFVNQGAVNRFLKKKQIDLIHSHTEFSMGYGAKKAAKKLKVPIVHTTHTMWEEYRHYVLNGKLLSVNMARRIIKTYLKKINAIVAPSVKAKKYYNNLTPEIPSVIINNGIDVEKFKSSVIHEHETVKLKKEFGLKKHDKIIIFVGRIGKEKRVSELLNSVIPVLKKHNNVKMIFVGDGPSMPDLAARVSEENLEGRVVFTGFVNWELVYRLYSIANIFVTASLTEVHPMTLIEAAMCSLTLIARKDDSYLDLVKNDYNGYLVDNDEGITEKLDLLLNNEKLLNEFSENSLVHSDNFTAERHVGKLERFYREVIKRYPDRMEELRELEL